MDPIPNRTDSAPPMVAAVMRGEPYPCPICGHQVPGRIAATRSDSPTGWTEAQARALDVFGHWSGSRQGWPTASAQKLLALLLYVSAHDRQQPVTSVPFSAARVRLLVEQTSLRTYLADTIATLDDPGAPAASAALRDLHFHHQYDGWDSSDGLSAPPSTDPTDYFQHGLPVAVQMLDAALLAERGGRVPGTSVCVVTPGSRDPEPAEIIAPLWQTRLLAGAPGMIDLEDGPPAGYTVRMNGYLELGLAAAAVTDTPPPSQPATTR